MNSHRHLNERYKYYVLPGHLKLSSAFQLAKAYMHDLRLYTAALKALQDKYGQPCQLVHCELATILNSPASCLSLCNTSTSLLSLRYSPSKLFVKMLYNFKVPQLPLDVPPLSEPSKKYRIHQTFTANNLGLLPLQPVCTGPSGGPIAVLTRLGCSLQGPTTVFPNPERFRNVEFLQQSFLQQSEDPGNSEL